MTYVLLSTFSSSLSDYLLSYSEVLFVCECVCTQVYQKMPLRRFYAKNKLLLIPDVSTVINFEVRNLYDEEENVKKKKKAKAKDVTVPLNFCDLIDLH